MFTNMQPEVIELQLKYDLLITVTCVENWDPTIENRYCRFVYVFYALEHKGSYGSEARFT